MELDEQESLGVKYSVDKDDPKNVARLSTVLVASIQEVKERICNIEFIFCSQIFPSFQSNCHAFEKRLVEAQITVESQWKKREISLLHQIEELQLEKQRAQDENHHLLSSMEHVNKKLLSHEKLLNIKETEVEKLQELLRDKTQEVSTKEKDVQQELLQQIKLKDLELLGERDKKREAVSKYAALKENYKILKSQYNFLLNKFGFKQENKLQHKEERDSPGSHHIQALPPKVENPGSKLLTAKTSQQNHDISFQEKMDNGGTVTLLSDFGIKPPSTSLKCNSFARSGSLVGVKQSISCWRETRARQGPDGDLHDDFLSTPIKKVKANLSKSSKEVINEPTHVSRSMDTGNSDDETQDLSVDIEPQKNQISITRPDDKGFKYVEPVRKKAERENLKGVECKQCKKFYDAVLHDDDGTNKNDVYPNNIRCEHHDGVSRHRYKYIPPMTPEGFWNIGFDSDV